MGFSISNVFSLETNDSTPSGKTANVLTWVIRYYGDYNYYG